MDKPEDLLTTASSSILGGSRKMLVNPPFFECSHDIHEPFEIRKQPITIKIDERVSTGLCGVVQTSSWQYDGERTDLNDVWSLLWAAYLRATGVASTILVDHASFVSNSELGMRQLVIEPASWSLDDPQSFDKAFESLNAWTAFAYHMFDSAFGGARQFLHVPIQDEPAWIQKMNTLFNKSQRDYNASVRNEPRWEYFSILPKGISILKLPEKTTTALKGIFVSFKPQMTVGQNSLVIFANGLSNAVPQRTFRLAQKIFKQLDEPHFRLILPIDTHCLFFGKTSIVSIREDCSRFGFEEERKLFLKKRAEEDAVFFADSTIEWNKKIDPSLLETLCADLLERQPGVVHAKPVGPTNNADGGRDIMVDWIIPKHDSADKISSSPMKILVQVKKRKQAVGINDAQNIRDTLDHYKADGYFLIAYPCISAPLFDRLDGLRDRYFVHWWELRNLNEMLRRHPDIAKRYPELLELHHRD